jgi:hypothetical protein
MVIAFTPRKLRSFSMPWFAPLSRVLLLVCTVMTYAVTGEVPPVVSEIRTAVAVELSAEALPLAHEQPVIDVVSSYDPDAGTMTGTLRMVMPNTYGMALPELGFVLHANNSRSYVDTPIKITGARVGSQVVEPQLVEEGRGVLVPLAKPLAPGAWISCELDFITTVPTSGGRAGLLTRSPQAHYLYSWLPEPAVYRDGWSFPALVPYSDPCFVQSADYRWRLTMPPAWTLVAGGQETRQADGSWLVLAPRTRNLVAWVSDRPVEILRVTPPTGPEVRVIFSGKNTVRAAFCASVARDALALASEAFGAYPRRSYDLVFVTFALPVGGMEASGMTFLHLPLFERLNWRGRDPLTDQENSLLHATVHEVLHSWWYDQVGNDTHLEPWLDEPLTEWSSWYVMERLRSKDTMQMLIGTRLPAMVAIAKEPKAMNSAGDTMNDMQFGVLLYCRGPLMYEALRQEVGDERFLAALKQWYRDHSGGVVTRTDWERTFLALLPPERRAPFLDSWITGINDPVPASMDQVLKSGQAAAIRVLVDKERAGAQAAEQPSSDTDGGIPPKSEKPQGGAATTPTPAAPASTSPVP